MLIVMEKGEKEVRGKKWIEKNGVLILGMDINSKELSTIQFQSNSGSFISCSFRWDCALNPFTPNDPHRGRTAPLTSKFAFYIFIQQI